MQAALKAELAGASDERARLLAAARELDPDYAPAWWQSGHVRVGQEWVAADELSQRVGDDPSMATYREKRAALVDTADQHRALARWCHKNELLDQERVHWLKVLAFEPQNAEALKALGLELYQGRLMTRAQIDAAKQKAGEQLRAARKWQPKFVAWRKAIEGSDTKRREAALDALSKFDDPAALPALVGAFTAEGDSERSVEVNGRLIDTLARFPEQDATQALLGLAVLHDSPKVRQTAAAALKKRPITTYVPQLIAALPETREVESSYMVYRLPTGEILCDWDTVERFPEQGQAIGTKSESSSMTYPTCPERYKVTSGSRPSSDSWNNNEPNCVRASPRHSSLQRNLRQPIPARSGSINWSITPNRIGGLNTGLMEK